MKLKDLLNKTQLQHLKQTKDDDLLHEFPNFKRSDLRRLKNNAVKILVFDIETSPMKAFAWGLFDQNINIDQIIDDWFVICWSAKWLLDGTIMSSCVTAKEAKKCDDKRVVTDLWKLLDEADIVVAHNGDKFDIKMMNTRFIKHNLNHPSFFRSVDTLKVAKKEFRISSNKLDYLCKFLGLETKADTGGFTLWKDCLEGKQEALDKMQKYCNQDVRILEELYLTLLPYIRNHPTIGLFIDDKGGCPNCGSQSKKKCGFYNTQKRRYQSYRCECGTIYHE